jgi:hypothetical protein
MIYSKINEFYEFRDTARHGWTAENMVLEARVGIEPA